MIQTDLKDIKLLNVHTKNPATGRGDRLCFRNLNNYFSSSYMMISWILYIQTNHR